VRVYTVCHFAVNIVGKTGFCCSVFKQKTRGNIDYLQKSLANNICNMKSLRYLKVKSSSLGVSHGALVLFFKTLSDMSELRSIKLKLELIKKDQKSGIEKVMESICHTLKQLKNLHKLAIKSTSLCLNSKLLKAFFCRLSKLSQLRALNIQIGILKLSETDSIQVCNQLRKLVRLKKFYLNVIFSSTDANFVREIQKVGKFLSRFYCLEKFDVYDNYLLELMNQ